MRGKIVFLLLQHPISPYKDMPLYAKIGVPLYTKNAFSVYKGSQYSHIRAHIKLGTWLQGGIEPVLWDIFRFFLATIAHVPFRCFYMWIFRALICKYWCPYMRILGEGCPYMWKVGVLIFELWACPYIRAMGMPLYSRQFSFLKGWKTTHFPHKSACPYMWFNTVILIACL